MGKIKIEPKHMPFKLRIFQGLRDGQEIDTNATALITIMAKSIYDLHELKFFELEASKLPELEKKLSDAYLSLSTALVLLNKNPIIPAD